MKRNILRKLLLAGILTSSLAIAVGCSHSGNVGTSQQISHTESDTTGWFGGTTHKANTVYQNSDGSKSVETESTTAKDGTTTIVRVRTTTFVDGSVKTDRETRTIVRGTDNVVTESKVVK